MKPIRIATFLLGGLAAVAAATSGAFPAGAAYPEKPVKVVIPYGAGGSSDIVARTIVNRVNELKLLPKPVVVVNVDAGAGNVGFQQVKDATPDGYEILVTHIGMLVSTATKRINFGPEAFEAIAQTGSVRLVLAVKTDGEYKTFADVVAAAKAKPGEIPTASAIGSSVHLAGLMLSKATGIKFRMVHVGGGSERIKSVLGGHTAHSFFSTAEYQSFKDSGIKALMMLGPERHPDFPDIPCSKDLGYSLDFGIDYWWFAPKGTPKDRVDMLAKAWGVAMADKALQASLKEKGIAPNFLSGEALDKHMRSIHEHVMGFGPELMKK